MPVKKVPKEETPKETKPKKRAGLQKGQTNNPNGRPVGLRVNDIREALSDLIKTDFNKIKSALRKVYKDNPKAYLDNIHSLMKYAAPAVTATQFQESKKETIDPTQLSNDELDQLLKLMNKATSKENEIK